MALTDETKQSIITALNTSSLDESFIEAVLKRLDSFGYEIKESDAWMIGFAMQKVENHIKNFCNTDSIPDGLFNATVDRVCGEFLFTKKQTGQLNIGELDLDGAVTSIKEGDTQINFDAGSSDESRFNQLVNYLMNQGEGDLICFRKIRW